MLPALCLLCVPLHFLAAGHLAEAALRHPPGARRAVYAALPLATTLAICLPLRSSMGPMTFLYSYFLLGLSGCKVRRNDRMH